MKRRYGIIAVPILVCGTALAGASQASARPIYPDEDYPGASTVVPGPIQEVQVDDNLAETLQTGAGAVGGAGLAIAGLWLYRRRHPIPVH
jgi:hypothetical protein